MLPRTLEPEAMDTEEEARDYDAMDHTEVNRRFCDDLVSTALRRDASVLSSPGRRVLDVGTGTARIAIELALRWPGLQIDAIDLAEPMLASAERNVARAELSRQVRLTRADAKKTDWPNGAFDVVMSNSLVHHIPEVRDVLGEMWRLVAPRGMLFVRDLSRPFSEGRARELVRMYSPHGEAADPSLREAQTRQRALFEASFHAALTVDEIRAAVAPLGIPEHAIQMTSDRHWTLGHVKP